MIKLLGFTLGHGQRMVDPAKAKALKERPAPESLDDLVSFRASANFIKEFILDFHECDRWLRPYAKKGAKF